MHDRAINAAKTIWLPLAGVAVAFLFATAYYTPLYNNYLQNPAMMLIPILAVALFLTVPFLLKGKKLLGAFAASAGFILLITLFGVLGMYPAIIPSSISPEASITVAKAASSQLTLSIMLYVTLACVPVVIGYQAWVYSIFSHKVTPEDLDSDHAY
jgi:cytochrome d ubiquinol oxidase subunit II